MPIVAALSGALTSLAFPPYDLGPLAWVSLVPMFYVLGRVRGAASGALCGLVFGLAFMGTLLGSFTLWGLLPWLLLSAYQALYFALFGALAGPAMRSSSPFVRPFAAAAAYALGPCLLRSGFRLAPFSGGDLALSQYDHATVIQVCSVFGQLGLTFLMALVNAALAQGLLGVLPAKFRTAPMDTPAWSRTASGVAVLAYGLVFSVYFGGAYALARAKTPSGARELSIAIVQGSVPVTGGAQGAEVAAHTYTSLNETVPPNTDLAIWPESAIPGFITLDPLIQDAVRQGAGRFTGHLLMGSLEVEGDRHYNAAVLLDPEGQIVDRYHKNDLVMFGEWVPLRDKLPLLNRYPIRRHDLSPGRERKLFDVSGIRVAPLICFEAIFSDPTREVCRMGAQMVAVLTSDAWAQGTVEAAQHSATAPFRAVEARKYVCRAASDGRSAIYDPWGRPLAQVPVDLPGVISESVPALDGLSIYHRIGNAPLVTVCILLIIVGWVAGWQEGGRPHAATDRDPVQSQ